MKITAESKTLGASIEGYDLSIGAGDSQRDLVERLLGEHGVLCFRNQRLSALQLRDFSAQFGELEINVANTAQEPDAPEVMTLSNIVRDGKPIGLGDAGQGWHTDMSYSRTVAFANVLHALKVPHRNGQALGATQFSDMAAAYDALPAGVKERIAGLSAVHDFNKFWEMMRTRPGSLRKPLTAEQRAARPPASHPLVMAHPISGRRLLYCNPGYAIRIEGVAQVESDKLLEFLFGHQLQQDFIYTHRWSEGDVLMWDNLRTIHQAIADYRPDEPRLIKRCQVMATRYLIH